MWRFLFFFPLCSLFADLSALYLSWYGDPSTTMTIQWLSSVEELGDKVVFEDADGNWLEAVAGLGEVSLEASVQDLSAAFDEHIWPACAGQ